MNDKDWRRQVAETFADYYQRKEEVMAARREFCESWSRFILMKRGDERYNKTFNALVMQAERVQDLEADARALMSQGMEEQGFSKGYMASSMCRWKGKRLKPI